ncbi:MAG: hypothetical protein ABFS86_10470, partial [Planctomycetota bacterium]
MTRLGRWLRRILVTFAVLLILLAGAWIFRWTLIGGTVRRALSEAAADYDLAIEVTELSGTLLGDVTARRVLLSPTTPEPHLVREGRVDRIRVDFHLLGLLAGDDRWLRKIHVEGVRAVLDVRAPLPAPESEPDPAPEPAAGAMVLPSLVRVTDVELTLCAGPSRIEFRNARIDVAEVADRDWRGRAQAALLRSRIEGESDEFADPYVEVEYVGGCLCMTDGGGRELIRADVSRIEEGFIEADVDLALFGGQITGRVRTERGTDTVTANLDLADLRAPRLLRFLPEIPVEFREVSGSLEAVLADASEPHLDGLAGTFRLALSGPRVQRWAAERVEISGNLEHRAFTVRGTTVEPDTGFDGRLWLEEVPRFEADVDLDAFDLSLLGLDIEDRGIRGTATGRASVAGTAESPVFSGDLTIVEPGYGEWSAERIEARGRGGPAGIDLERFLAVRGRDRVEVKGQIEFSRNVTFTATGSVDVESADVIVTECGVPYPDELDGAVRVTFTAEPAPDGSTRILATSLHVTSPPIVAEGADVVTRLPPLNVDFDADAIAIDGRLALRGVEAARFTDRFGIEPWGEASATGELVVRGTIGDLDASVYLNAKDVVLRPPHREEVLLSELTLLARHDGDGLALEQLLANGRHWGLVASGRLAWDPLVDPVDGIGDAAVDGQLNLVDFPLSVSRAIPALADATGTVDARLAFSGTVAKPGATGTIDVTAGRLRAADDRIPDVTDLDVSLALSDAGLDGVRVDLRPSTARILDALVSLDSGGANLSFAPFRISAPSLVARVRDLDAGLLGVQLGTDEVLAGDVEVDVSVTRGSGVDGPEADVVVRGGNFRFAAAERFRREQSDGHLDLRAHWGPKGIRVENATLIYADRTLRLDAQIPISPSLDPIGIVRRDGDPIHVTVAGTDLDLAELSRTLPRLRLGGRADLSVELAGTLGESRGRAALTVRDGFARYPGVPDFDGIRGSFRLEPDAVVTVDKLGFQLGRGELTVDPGGTVQLVRSGPNGFDFGRMNLEIRGKNALLTRTRTMLVRAAPDLKLSGGGDRPRLLSGRLDISSVRYTQRIELISRRPSLAPLPLTEDPFLTSLNLDVRVHAPRESI